MPHLSKYQFFLRQAHWDLQEKYSKILGDPSGDCLAKNRNLDRWGIEAGYQKDHLFGPPWFSPTVPPQLHHTANFYGHSILAQGGTCAGSAGPVSPPPTAHCSDATLRWSFTPTACALSFQTSLQSFWGRESVRSIRRLHTLHRWVLILLFIIHKFVVWRQKRECCG